MTEATSIMSEAEFDELFLRVSNGGRWGPDDERGTLNLLTAPVVQAAGALVANGVTVSLSHDLDTVAGPDNARPALHYMTQLADVGTAEPKVNMDFVGTDFHGKSVTHLDALCHVNFRGRLYNGVSADQVVTSTGSAFGSVMNAADGIVSRGILLDVPRHRGASWVEPGSAVDIAELEDVAQSAGVEPRPGDVVFVRTGARRRRDECGAWDPSNLSAGLYPDVLEWLHTRQVAVLGSDGDSDTRPSPVEGVESPIHALALGAMGMPLIDNAALEAVARTCAEFGRWTFCCVLAPLRVPGGTGSPVNPIAIF